MWLQAQTADEKFKQDAQTQDCDGMQAMSVFYMKELEATSQKYYNS